MKRVTFLILSAALIFCVLILPNHPGTMRLQAFNRFPLELPALLLGALAIGSRRAVPALLALILLATVILKLADFGMFQAYNRTFNPILDAFLIEAGLGLLRDSIGTPLVVLAVIATIFGALAISIGLFAALRQWSSVRPHALVRTIGGITAMIFAGITIADAGHSLKYWQLSKSPPGTSWTTRLSFKRAVEVRNTAIEMVAFRDAAQIDPYTHSRNLLGLLNERDVIFIFVESYGRASFDNPLYARHKETLSKAETELEAAGLAMRSGWLTSPTAGGQSWLAHGTLSSGLWTSDNGRYNAMLTSERKSLFHIASEAGFRTSAVMPAITLAWPESSLMGFEQVLAADDLDYRGERFNWVTMPDQFVLSAYGSLLGEDPRNDFIQIALVSSHAPWVPIPPVIDWDTVGDGAIFTQWATQGPSPREVWKDRDKIRAQYAIAVDYALEVVMSHVARLGPDAPLVVVLGDHQAVGFVAGSDNKDVPVHMIGAPESLAHIAHWEWSSGLIPAPDAPLWRMDAFRGQFIESFSVQPVAEGQGG